MNLLGIRAFSTELIKIALELQDAGVRDLLAERRGDPDYLPEGRLNTNSPAETNFMPKIGSKRRLGLESTNPMTTPLDRLRSTTKKPGHYQEARDTALTGLGGALTGASALRLSEKMRRSQPTSRPRSYMAAAGIGAAAGIADRVYRHYRPSVGPAQSGPDTTKMATIGAPSTPGMMGMAARRTGMFEHTIHTGAPARAPGLLGRVGRLPR